MLIGKSVEFYSIILGTMNFIINIIFKTFPADDYSANFARIKYQLPEKDGQI